MLEQKRDCSQSNFFAFNSVVNFFPCKRDVLNFSCQQKDSLYTQASVIQVLKIIKSQEGMSGYGRYFSYNFTTNYSYVELLSCVKSQSIYQSVSRSINYPVKQPVNQSESVNQLVVQSGSQSVCLSVIEL